MLTAIPIIKGKYWVVKQGNDQVATIQTSPTGVTYVFNEKREQFVSINLLKAKHNISFTKAKTNKKEGLKINEVNSYPCDHKPFNSLFNVSMKLPVYTKSGKSKSFYCAGYYLVKYNTSFMLEFCPKLITLNRYEYLGPFHSKTEAALRLTEETK